MNFTDLGKINYKDAWDFQHKLFNENIENKRLNKPTKNKLLFCEHNNVYTIGKSGNQSNLLLNNISLKDKGIEFYNIDRGGDITYHGHGQIVAYPIFDLDTLNIGTREYIYKLENTVIKTMEEYGIECGRLDGAAGIWIEPEIVANSRKICAIGVRSSHRITMHGLALNVNTDLTYYNYINPCGFTERGVTSMQKELNKHIDFEDVKAALLKNFRNEFAFIPKQLL
ncbi:MAG: lipoyl(octanoyl) transferase LipB [Bacteroidales bacterium]|nr:lipoyl(octanoyl) transferase LipB [Bacteroidales bacterium]MBN2758029.1 lipoyl(octanoyl) transferase LipB [Bacteroidales bacterium]